MRFYKKKCELNNVPLNKIFRTKVEEVVDEGENLEKCHLWEELNPVGCRAIFDALTDLKFNNLL